MIPKIAVKSSSASILPRSTAKSSLLKPRLSKRQHYFISQTVNDCNVGYLLIRTLCVIPKKI
eukprot:snap_masked-scaffold_60-processed-gene-0.14-mRNA-1 protein AED:1.00 eAED:1.00 QI:0/0/0/0/1/1/2/0/61